MNFPRSAGIVILFALLIVLLSVFGSVTALVNIPSLQLTRTPHASAGTPTFTVGLAEAVQQQGDPQRGEQLFTSMACAACHLQENGTAPNIDGISQRAVTRREGYSSEAYLYESITNPNAYIVTDYQAGVMPQNFATRLSQQDLYDLIAWLLTK
jgi:cytochrome c2